MGRRVLITGYGGFVGPNLAKEFQKAGYDVFGLVRKKSTTDSDIIIIEGDINDETGLAVIIKEISPEIIIHLAALSRVGFSFEYPARVIETNVVGTVNLLECVRNICPECRIVFASSGEVYGQKCGFNPKYISETELISPITSPYSISKVCGEHLMECYHRSYGIDVVIIRSFNIEGPGRGDNFATSTICRQAVDIKCGKKNSYIIGNLAVFRDFTHIFDATRIYALIAEKGESGEIYNLGHMQLTSLASFLVYVTESAGNKVDSVIFGDGTVVSSPLSMVENCFVMPVTTLDACLLKKPDLVSYNTGNVILKTSKGDIEVVIDLSRFRPAENPVMVADNTKLMALGFKFRYSVKDIADDQVKHYIELL